MTSKHDRSGQYAIPSNGVIFGCFSRFHAIISLLRRYSASKSVIKLPKKITNLTRFATRSFCRFTRTAFIAT